MFRVTHRPSPGAKTVLAASGFAYMEGCWTYSWWTLSGSLPDSVHQLLVQQSSTYEKPEAVSVVLGF
jgi:predicted transcriptional regulator